MPNGFIGSAPKKYLTETDRALQSAVSIHSANGHTAPFRNETPPYTPQDALTGSYILGVGNSSNIVADRHIYNDVAQKTAIADDRISDSFYSMALEVEEMCRTIFILPRVTPKVLTVIGELKNSLVDFRRLTDEHVEIMRNYARDITAIGGNSPGADIDLVWNQSSAESVRNETESSMRRQISNMEDTIQNHQTRIARLEAEAAVQDHIAANAMKTIRTTVSLRVPDVARRSAASARAANLRQEIAMLRQAISNLNAGISELQSDISSTNRLFNSLQDEIHQTDKRYADLMRQNEEGMRAFNVRMGEIYNSFDDSFPMSTPSGWVAALGGNIKSRVRDMLLEAKSLGLAKLSAFFGDPVNMSTGNFVYFKDDITVPGAFPLEFKRFYNAMGNIATPLGANWTHNYNIRLHEEDSGAVVTFGDGRIEGYQDLGIKEGYYSGEPGSKNRLEKIDDDKSFVLTTAEGEKYIFDEPGRLKIIRDKNDNETFFTYTENTGISEEPLLSKVATPSGSLEFAYSKNGLLTEVRDHTDRKVQFEYANNLLTKVTVPTGSAYEYKYNPSGLVSEIINPVGIATVKNIYDSQGRMQTQHMPDGGIMEYAYRIRDDRSTVTTYTRQDGVKTKFTSDEKHRTTAVQYPDGQESRVFNEKSQVIEKTDKNGNTTLFEYDLFGNVTKITDPLKHESIFEYDIYDIMSISREGRVLVSFDYDTKGNVKETRDPLGRTVVPEYSKNGLPTKITAQDGSINILKYDSKCNITSVTDALGNTTNYEYNSLNQVVRVTQPEGNTLQLAYNTKGDISQVTNSEGNTRHYSYDARGKVTEVRDWDGSVSTFAYNKQGHLEEFTDTMGNRTIYTYDTVGNLLEITDPGEAITSYTYDQLDRPITVTDPRGHTTHYEYDPNGNVTAVISPLGNRTEVSYDALDRQEKITRPDGSQVKLTYDPFGNVTQAGLSTNLLCYLFNIQLF